METEKKTEKKVTEATGIWAKLMEIQRANLTLSVSELSDKIDPNTKRPAYTYTPGWQIVENIRKMMDQKGLMLIPEFHLSECKLIDYPVYLMVGNEARSFIKKEIHFVVDADFTWIDTTTNEKAGPFHIVASGANGTDKSSASALALAERYFLLKFFHITTHEAADEPDAHDCDNLPGVGKLPPASARQTVASQPQGQGQSHPTAQTYAPQQTYTPPQQQPVQQPAVGRQNSYPNPPAYGPAGPVPASGLDINNPAVTEAVTRLAQFERQTASHAETLNKVVGELCAKGFPMTQQIVDQLVACGQRLRETGSMY